MPPERPSRSATYADIGRLMSTADSVPIAIIPIFD